MADNMTGQYPREQVFSTAKSLLVILNKMRSDRFETWSEKLKGMTKIELHILLLVQSQPDIVLGEIRDRLDVPNSTLTGIIDRMEKQGLVRRTISVRDRRSYGLELTDNGREIRQEHDRILLMIVEKMLGTLDDAEIKTFVRLLSKVADNMRL
jgi:DNA-binding MarR family transcriptional regulator